MCTPTQTTTRHTSTAWTEARLLINLAIPTVVIELGGTLPPALTASYIGRHLGAIYLDGFTLASLTGNLFTLSLLSGLFSASDTLSPQAFGAGNYKEVGLLAIRAYIASLLLIIPINILLAVYMKDILIYVGENDKTALLAAQWYRVYMCGLPFYSFYNVTWKFLSAQEVMTPLIVVLIATCGIVLPLTLHQLVPRFGFMGSAYSIFIYQASQAAFLLLYLVYYKPFIPMTWPGLQFWREALQKDKFRQFMRLGLGGMVASSEWLYWETLSLLVGTLGVLPLSVHTIPTQVLTVSFMIPIGIGIALSIRLGATLPRNVQRAQQLVVACTLVSTCLFAVMSVCLWIFRDRIFRLFTSEQNVLQGCEEIWWKVVVYFFVLAIYGVIIGIATGLGMQWTLGVVTFVFLWVFGLPAVYFFALIRGGGLGAAWTWVYPPYIVMNVVMIAAFLRADWHAISANIRKREGLTDSIIDQGDIEALVMHNATLKYGSTTERSVATVQ
jgi:MATE family multidrug resistance protein